MPPTNAELDRAGEKRKYKKRVTPRSPRGLWEAGRQTGGRAYRLSPFRLVVVSGGVHDVVVFGLPRDAPHRGSDHSPGCIGGDGNPSSSALQAMPSGRVTGTFRFILYTCSRYTEVQRVTPTAPPAFLRHNGRQNNPPPPGSEPSYIRERSEPTQKSRALPDEKHFFFQS